MELRRPRHSRSPPARGDQPLLFCARRADTVRGVGSAPDLRMNLRTCTTFDTNCHGHIHMIAVALVLAGAAFAVATVALLVGLRAYDVALHLQSMNQNPRTVSASELVPLHLEPRSAFGDFVTVRARRASAPAETTH